MFYDLMSSFNQTDSDHLRRCCRQRYAFSSVMQMAGDIIIAPPSHTARVLPYPAIRFNYFPRLMKRLLRARFDVEPIAPFLAYLRN
jgi:hypothetical protein